MNKVIAAVLVCALMCSVMGSRTYTLVWTQPGEGVSTWIVERNCAEVGSTELWEQVATVTEKKCTVTLEVGQHCFYRVRAHVPCEDPCASLSEASNIVDLLVRKAPGGTVIISIIDLGGSTS